MHTRLFAETYQIAILHIHTRVKCNITQYFTEKQADWLNNCGTSQ